MEPWDLVIIISNDHNMLPSRIKGKASSDFIIDLVSSKFFGTGLCKILLIIEAGGIESKRDSQISVYDMVNGRLTIWVPVY